MLLTVADGKIIDIQMIVDVVIAKLRQDVKQKQWQNYTATALQILNNNITRYFGGVELKSYSDFINSAPSNTKQETGKEIVDGLENKGLKIQW